MLHLIAYTNAAPEKTRPCAGLAKSMICERYQAGRKLRAAAPAFAGRLAGRRKFAGAERGGLFFLFDRLANRI